VRLGRYVGQLGLGARSAGRRAVIHAALVAWQPRLRAHRIVSRPEYLYIAAVRAVVRFCREESELGRGFPGLLRKLSEHLLREKAAWQPGRY
jgi:hypothetical protein